MQKSPCVSLPSVQTQGGWLSTISIPIYQCLYIYIYIHIHTHLHICVCTCIHGYILFVSTYIAELAHTRRGAYKKIGYTQRRRLRPKLFAAKSCADKIPQARSAVAASKEGKETTGAEVSREAFQTLLARHEIYSM